MILFESVRIRDIGEVVTGKTPKTEDHENFGKDYMFIGPTDLHKHFFIINSEKMISEKGLKSIKGSMLNGVSILVGCIGWDMGNVGIVDGKCATNQQINSITNIDKKYNPLYIYYWLKNKKDFLFQQASVTRTPILNKTSFSEIRISVPVERHKQDKVVNLLVAIDKKIELNNRINAELEAMAKTLYDYWFVQFDFPDANGKPYKSSGGKMVYNPILKREIPEGWEAEPLTNSCQVIDCLHSKKPNYQFEVSACYLLQLENILDNGQIDISNKYYVSKSDYDKWTIRIKVKEHDVVMTNAGRIAAFAQIPEGVVCGIGRNITSIRPDSVSPNYFFLSLASIDVQRQISTNLDHGAFFKSFNVKGIKALNLLRPTLAIEKRFEDSVKSMIKMRNTLKQENEKLISLRDWLLPMLMNGQVTVK